MMDNLDENDFGKLKDQTRFLDCNTFELAQKGKCKIFLQRFQKIKNKLQS
jgi:hypothetical protein